MGYVDEEKREKAKLLINFPPNKTVFREKAVDVTVDWQSGVVSYKSWYDSLPEVEKRNAMESWAGSRTCDAQSLTFAEMQEIAGGTSRTIAVSPKAQADTNTDEIDAKTREVAEQFINIVDSGMYSVLPCNTNKNSEDAKKTISEAIKLLRQAKKVHYSEYLHNAKIKCSDCRFYFDFYNEKMWREAVKITEKDDQRAEMDGLITFDELKAVITESAKKTELASPEAKINAEMDALFKALPMEVKAMIMESCQQNRALVDGLLEREQAVKTREIAVDVTMVNKTAEVLAREANISAREVEVGEREKQLEQDNCPITIRDVMRERGLYSPAHQPTAQDWITLEQKKQQWYREKAASTTEQIAAENAGGLLEATRVLKERGEDFSLEIVRAERQTALQKALATLWGWVGLRSKIETEAHLSEVKKLTTTKKIDAKVLSSSVNPLTVEQ